jgi:hypothetical protein
MNAMYTPEPSPALLHHSLQGMFIVTALAESNEGRVWMRLAAFNPKIPPLLLKVIDIIAGRDDLGVIVGLPLGPYLTWSSTPACFCR